MVVPQSMEMIQRWHEGEFEYDDDDPDDIENLTSGRAARDALVNQVDSERKARSQAVQATSTSSIQHAVAQVNGSTHNAFAQAEGPQDGMPPCRIGPSQKPDTDLLVSRDGRRRAGWRNSQL